MAQLTSQRRAIRVGSIGAAIALLFVAFDTAVVERHNTVVLGHHEWPDVTSAFGIGLFALVAVSLGFVAFFLATVFVLTLRRGAT